jgi:hypothetical protein
MRRTVLLITAVIAVGALLPAPIASAKTPNYLNLAKNGLSETHKYFWNSGEHWWNDDLSPGNNIAPNGVHIPLATVWSAVPLFEAFDGVALADPTKATKKAAANFAKYADSRYWNAALLNKGGWSPYPGDHGVDACVFFDDDGWWGLGFLDAYRATGNSRFLKDAKTTSDFVNARGWQGGGLTKGMKWDTWKGDPVQCPHSYALEALSSATALNAGIWEASGDPKYRGRAMAYIAWANKYAFDKGPDLYDTIFHLSESNGGQYPLLYVQGTMIGAYLSLCQGWQGKGDPKACAQLPVLANAAYAKWYGSGETYFPPQATVFFRYIVQLAAYAKDTTLWDWASQVAEKALNKSPGDHGLYLNCWDGRSPNSCGQNDLQYGQIKGHAATVALFAWLAAFPRP